MTPRQSVPALTLAWVDDVLRVVERTDDDLTANGYRLNGTGRYSHTPAYIRQTVQATGLTLRAINSGVTRQDGDQPVPGLVVLAQRGAIDVAV